MSHYKNIGCEFSPVLHIRVLYNVFVLKKGKNKMGPKNHQLPALRMPSAFLSQTETTFEDVRKKAMQAYIKKTANYNKKANAS